MNARKLGVAIAAATISFGILGISAPAHAAKAGKSDTTWGFAPAPVTKTPVKLK